MVALDLVEAYIEIGDKCSDCGICVRVCPMGALEIKE
jgi:NAD-dependent dihydropyrimidine dehydrogenase PreA subunit